MSPARSRRSRRAVQRSSPFRATTARRGRTAPSPRPSGIATGPFRSAMSCAYRAQARPGGRGVPRPSARSVRRRRRLIGRSEHADCTLSSRDMVRSKMTDLQIRGVPVALRDRLRRRAQRKGVSMSHYVTEMLQSELATPSVDEWLEEVAALPKADLRGADVGKLVRELDEQ